MKRYLLKKSILLRNEFLVWFLPPISNVAYGIGLPLTERCIILLGGEGYVSYGICKASDR